MLPAFASNFIPERNVLSYLRKRNIAGVICMPTIFNTRLASFYCNCTYPFEHAHTTRLTVSTRTRPITFFFPYDFTVRNL